MNTGVEDLPRRHLITVDEYCLMHERGLFAPEARMELIEGEIIDMAPVGCPHMAAVSRLNELLVLSFQGRAIVLHQGAIRLGNLSMPQPDVALLKPREDYYSRKHATPDDILLVIEVSDSTLRYDLGRKVSLYAKHIVPEVWVVNIQEQQVHFFRTLQEGAYTETSVVPAPDKAMIKRLPGATIDLSWLSRL